MQKLLRDIGHEPFFETNTSNHELLIRVDLLELKSELPKHITVEVSRKHLLNCVIYHSDQPDRIGRYHYIDPDTLVFPASLMC